MLREGREHIASEPKDFLSFVQRALKSADNNIIDWRRLVPLFDWFENQPGKASTHLQILWNEELDLSDRLSVFVSALDEFGIKQPGAQLVIGSTLLMALSANDFPPVRMDAFKAAMDLAGWHTLYSVKSAVQRYQLARDFMDAIIQESEHFGIKLRDRLDAQGVIWCVGGGWPKFPVPPNWINDPAQREFAEKLEYARELQELESEPGGTDLPITQKLVLVKARRGQDRFREDLLSFWANCAVTECSELTLLRASHIKPWEKSDNYERLDPYNGLLLAANVDAAFDKGFVTFNDNGQIVISSLLRSADRKALGIRRDFRLRTISPRHLRYLRYHRDFVFKKKKTPA